MPENEFPKIKTHPFRLSPVATARESPLPAVPDSSSPPYAELAITTNYTFLTGASHPEEMVEQAALLGHAAAAISDTNTLAGIVRAHVASETASIPLAVGARLRMHGHAGPGTLDLLAFASSRRAYTNLSRLLTLGKRRAPKGECHITLHDLIAHQEDLLAVFIPPATLDDSAVVTLESLRDAFSDDRLSLAAARSCTSDDRARLHRLHLLATHTRVPLVAINDVHYHIPARRPLQDIMTCIRHGCTIDEAGARLFPNAERALKSPRQMQQLLRPFSFGEKALARSVDIARRAAAFSLRELRYEYPAEACPADSTPIEHLRRLTLSGAQTRYGDSIPAAVVSQIDYELHLIEELHYEPYFLTCHDIVSFARSRAILCQGRGGAANSAVCYCLGITEVDPSRFSLLFERFISRARNEPPDIDIDFEHERREEVIQYIYRKYGREHAALTAEVITYRGRSAVREVGKAMGLSLDAVDTLARQLGHWHSGISEERVQDAGLSSQDPLMQKIIALSQELSGFPRHLSQHVGGFVITRSPLSDLVPIENAAMEDRTVIEWDKDDIDAMGMLKVDVLGLGMLTCIRKSLDLVNGFHADPQRHLTHEGIASDPTDSDVYDMICKADTVGVFQIESRAQMSMLPRLRPRIFYDLVIEVAIVRPGPIQGDMVHPYLRRRNGEEPIVFPNKDVERVLARTLGVPLFQEQAMQLAIVAAGFTPDEADQLRRAMAAWKRKGKAIQRFGVKLIEGMRARGYSTEFAERCFEQIKGFSEYGFPESHAASFAILVYVSCYLKHYHPAAFAAGLINSQPMGFYAPAQIVRDAQAHGVVVHPVDVNHSSWDCTLERGPGGRCDIRLGMRLVKGMQEPEANLIAQAAEERGRFATVRDLWRASGVTSATLRRLAQADAFTSMGLNRQQALWAIKPLRDEHLPLFETLPAESEEIELPAIKPGRQVLHDYQSVGLSLKAHPISFLRSRLDTDGVTPCEDLRSIRLCPHGRVVTVAGIVLVRQRPGTASGVVFITLEDETGIANLILWSDTFERLRKVARLSTALAATGRVERQGDVVHVHVTNLDSLDELLPDLDSTSRDFH